MEIRIIVTIQKPVYHMDYTYFTLLGINNKEYVGKFTKNACILSEYLVK